jgi:hypothetical protein
VTRLQDALEELSHDAPRATPRPELWDHGRRLRRRDRLVSSALVLVMVLLVGGLATLVTGPPTRVAPADSVVPEGAVPVAVEDVPDHVTEPTDSGLVVGPVSVAFVSGNNLPVVVGATDGRYRALDLPGWGTLSGALALSPNGRRLAWQAGGDKGPTRLSILTLETGKVVTAEVDARPGVRLRDLSWSPAGTQVAWVGDAPTAPRTVVGVVSFGGTARETPAPRPILRTVTGVAVDDTGTLALSRGNGTLVALLPDGEQRPISRSPVEGTPAHFSPSGEWLALSTGPGDSSAAVRDVGGRVVEHPFPDETFGAAAVRLQLLLVTSEDDLASEFVVTTPEVDGTSTWRSGVGTVDPVAASSLTVAVDLLPDPDASATQDLTHDFGGPDWPMSPGTRLGLLVAGGVLLAALLLTAYVLWRRTRRLL